MNSKGKYLKFDDTELDPNTLKEVQSEINETAESREKGLRSLKKKLSATTGLRAYLNDVFLLSYLRGSKYDFEKAYGRILQYYQYKKQYSDLLVFALPSLTLSAQQCKLMQILPYRAPDNSLLILCTYEFWNPSTVPAIELHFACNMLNELMLKNPVTQMCGATFILDFKNIHLSLLKELTPGILRMLSASMKACRLRCKALHVVHAPTIYHAVSKILHLILSNKLRSRLLVHPNNDDWKSLHSYLPPEILPKKYGGHIENIVDGIKMLSNEEDYFRNQMQYGYVY